MLKRVCTPCFCVRPYYFRAPVVLARTFIKENALPIMKKPFGNLHSRTFGLKSVSEMKWVYFPT